MDSFKNINWGDIAVKAGYALLILLVTWLIAKLVKSAFAKLATKVPALQKAGNDGQTLGASLGTIASLIIWLFGLVAVLQVFALDGVLSPITGMLEGILGFLPNLIGAAFVFFIGVVIARIVGQLIETSLRTVNWGKFAGQAAKGVGTVTDVAGSQRSSGSQFSAPTQQTSTQHVPSQHAPTQHAPTQQAPSQHAPSQQAPTQQWQQGPGQPGQPPTGQSQHQGPPTAQRPGQSEPSWRPQPGQQQQTQVDPGRPYGEQTAQHGGYQAAGKAQQGGIPSTIAKVVQALILIVVAIAALQILNIESVSRPAEQMLTTIFDAIPNIIGAGVVLAIGVVIANFASDLLGQLLDGMKVDQALQRAEILPADKSATPAITRVIQVAIVLFFAVMAAQLLGFPQITEFLAQVLGLGGKVLFGAAIVGVGVFIAQLLARTISGTPGQIVRYATIILFAAMGLKYMGVADSIIELAFGSLVVGGAVAAALAFGLGGREAAARQLQRLEAKRDANKG